MIQQWGKVAGNIGGAGLLVGIAATGLAAAIMGVGLLWLTIQWFVDVVGR